MKISGRLRNLKMNLLFVETKNSSAWLTVLF
jgi:hypothetical protein